MNKRLIAILLMLTLALTLALSACNGSAEKVTTSTKETTQSYVSAEQANTGKKVYFAGPLFNSGEKEFNLKMTKVLEDHGYQVFLPQRDGIEGALLEGKTEDELIEMIFPLDVKNVMDCDILFMNLDGRVPDEGACVELGIAYANNKRCYGFKTDTRAAEQGMDLNPMISGCMIKIFKNFDGDKLIEELTEYLENNSL